MTVQAATTWAVHLPTADSTRLGLVLEPPADGDPWPLALALGVLDALGARRCGRPDAVGRGRGRPLITRAEVEWDGAALQLVASHAKGLDELVVEAPCWDELVALPAWSEDRWWELVDQLATATGARAGALGDEEPLSIDPRGPGGWRAALRRQFAVLLPSPPDQLGGIAAVYRELPLSGLVVLLR